MKLFYLPLEAYKERYSWFMSCKDGWAETSFKKLGIKFERIEGDQVSNEITTGVVLDAFGRSKYSMSQISKVIDKIKAGQIKEGDIIYTEDFWTPGIESLFYIRQLTGIKFKVGCFFHAQSVDDTDFTYSMKTWIRHIERGLSYGYDYIFICSDILKRLCLQNRFAGDKFYVVGLPFNSERLKEQVSYSALQKEPFVLFSSRFDREKNPMFFLDLVQKCPDIQFKLVKPRKKITNDKEVQERLESILKTCKNLEVVNTSDKAVYYNLLNRAKVQFNCALQDWVSWTLLEAVAFGCNPLYPNWKDFPVELKGFEEKCIYEKDNLIDCERKLRILLNTDFDPALNKIVDKHDHSWQNYLNIMGLRPV